MLRCFVTAEPWTSFTGDNKRRSGRWKRPSSVTSISVSSLGADGSVTSMTQSTATVKWCSPAWRGKTCSVRSGSRNRRISSDSGSSSSRLINRPKDINRSWKVGAKQYTRGLRPRRTSKTQGVLQNVLFTSPLLEGLKHTTFNFYFSFQTSSMTKVE